MNGAAQLIQVLTSQLGYHEGRDPDGNWNNNQKYSGQTPGLQWSNYQPWCCTFVCWGAHQEGLDSLFPLTAACGTAVDWWKAKGRFSEFPVIGGPFFMGPDGTEHTGVVVRYDNENIYTIEGNTNDNGSYQGDGVYEHTRPRRGANSPYGYGVPAYPEGVTAADPKWGGVAAANGPKSSGKALAGDVGYVPFPGAAFFKPGHKSPVIAAMHKRLVAVGCNHYRTSTNLDVWGSGDVASYAAWQRKLGFKGTDANGIPGRTSWDILKVPRS